MSANALAKRCERKFVDVVLGDVEHDGTFSGYASLFGRVDLGKDVVERGAFANSLSRRKASGIRMLFQHDPNEPIGVWTDITEDQRGLFVRGRLNSDVGRAREVLSLMRSGALDGLSIGFKALKTRRDVAHGVRRIFEADLWEISVVTFPMLPDARIETVKGKRARLLPTLKEFETWLRREAGLSRNDARTVMTKGFESLVRTVDATPGSPKDLAMRIREFTRIINKRGLSI